jgi:hypothetical protein
VAITDPRVEGVGDATTPDRDSDDGAARDEHIRLA